LGTFAVRSSETTLTESPEDVYVSGSFTGPIPSCDDAGEPCIEPRPDVSPGCFAVRGTASLPRHDYVWWVLAANPFVVVADATPTTYDDRGSPVDLFGGIKAMVRGAQHAPELESDDWSDPCDGVPVSDEGGATVQWNEGETGQE